MNTWKKAESLTNEELHDNLKLAHTIIRYGQFKDFKGLNKGYNKLFAPIDNLVNVICIMIRRDIFDE